MNVIGKSCVYERCYHIVSKPAAIYTMRPFSASAMKLIMKSPHSGHELSLPFDGGGPLQLLECAAEIGVSAKLGFSSASKSGRPR
jgi:hypothetical protein